MEPTFLGLDLSTQRLKATIIARGLKIVQEQSVSFDKDLPHYGTTGGAIRGSRGEVTSPVEMWLEAFDLLLQRLEAANVDMGSIVAISGAGQQHGSVYWSAKGPELLESLDPTKKLHIQLVPQAFTLLNAPIWQDSSTTDQCVALEQAIGGAQRLADISGSRAYERFTASQIAKIRCENPLAYEATVRISLVSSWIASIFLGKLAPIEVSDASGMNLMDISTLKWNDELLHTCGGPQLRAKLGGEPVPGGTILGKISPWWVHRWGFNKTETVFPKDCVIAPFTGDNPATVAGLSTPGDAILSLGTSTTFLLDIPPASTPPTTFTNSHLLAHPTQTDPPGYIAMLCYKNGALAREEIRNRYSQSSWDVFNAQIANTPSGNDGWSGIYFLEPEIIPLNVQGEFFFKNGQPLVDETPPQSCHARAILESQFLSIKARILSILPKDSPPLKRLVITGGTSSNKSVLQLAADLFGMDVYSAETTDAAGVGGALLAQYTWWKANHEPMGTFKAFKVREGEKLGLVARPNRDQVQIYDHELLDRYLKCEDFVSFPTEIRGKV